MLKPSLEILYIQLRDWAKLRCLEVEELIEPFLPPGKEVKTGTLLDEKPVAEWCRIAYDMSAMGCIQLRFAVLRKCYGGEITDVQMLELRVGGRHCCATAN